MARLITLMLMIAGTTVSLQGQEYAAAQQVGAIRGVVWHDDNGDGKQDAAEMGHANWPIFLRDQSTQEIVEIRSGNDGTYEFSALGEGRYTVYVTAGPYDAWVTAPVRAVEGAAAVDVNLGQGQVFEVDFGIHLDTGVPRLLGFVTIDGELPLTEPAVHAWIDGKLCSVLDPVRPPQAGPATYHIAVLPDKLLPGCGENGKTVRFTVDHRVANETAQWPLSQPTLLPLTVGSVRASTEAAAVQPTPGTKQAQISPPETGSGGLR